MSPPPARKSTSKKAARGAPKRSGKPARKATAPKKAARKASKKAPKASKGARKSARPARSAKAPSRPTRSAAGTCPALDPFGDPCQNTPRLGSRYCGVHSYLE